MKRLSPQALFAFLWASATLFSLTSNIGWHTALVDDPFSLRSIADTALALSCLALLLYPSSIKQLLTVSVLQIVEVLVLLPNAPNHRLVLFFANIVVLLYFLCVLSGKNLDEKRFRSTIVVLLATVYLFAFFAKLNTAFFDPAMSCAVQFSAHIADLIQLSPSGAFFGYGVMWYTVIAELGIALLLLCSRTRMYGVLLGVVFHITLSLDIDKHFYDFSSVMITLLLACIPAACIVEVQKHWSWLMPSTKILRWIYAVTFVLIIALGMSVASGYPMDKLVILLSYMLWQLFCVLALLLAGTAARLASHHKLPTEPLTLFCSSYALLAVLVLNGVSPYIGLKSRTSFSMYSNLRVEPDYSNHLLIPKSADLFGYQSGRPLDSFLEKKLLIFQPLGEISERECIW